MRRSKKSDYQFLSDADYEALVAYARSPKTEKEKRFIRLGWQLIEAKYQYYYQDAPVLSDHEYDRLEREYDALAKELGLPASAADMVGFDSIRPACRLAADKVDGRNPPAKP